MVRRGVHALAVVWVSFVVLLALAAPQGVDDRLARGEWPYYSGDNGSAKYSPLDQINRGTVAGLRGAWRHPQIDPALVTEHRLRLSNNFRSTPIFVDGVLYVSNAFGLAEALDPATGRTRWMQQLRRGRRCALGGRVEQPRRGVLERGRRGAHPDVRQQLPVRARTRRPARRSRPSATSGRVDLRAGLGPLIEATRGLGVPLVVGDVVLVGSSMVEQDSAVAEGGPARRRARIRRAHGQALRWTLPHHPACRRSGHRDLAGRRVEVHRRGQRLVDRERRLTSSATSTCRPRASRTTCTAATAWATISTATPSSALDAKTGKRVWYFQTVHHDLFDYDTARRADPRRHHRRRPALKARRADHEAGLRVRARPRDGQARLADRGAPRAAVRPCRARDAARRNRFRPSRRRSSGRASRRTT